MSVPVVVGAYPQPFLHGHDERHGRRCRPEVARAIAGQVHGTSPRRSRRRNYIVISRSYATRARAIERFRDGALLELGAAVAAAARRRPTALRAATESRHERRARRRAARRARGRGAARLASVGRSRSSARCSSSPPCARRQAPLAVPDRRADERRCSSMLLTPFVEVIGSHRSGPGRRSRCSARSTSHARSSRTASSRACGSAPSALAFAVYALLDRPRPAARLRGLGPTLDGRGRARDAARADCSSATRATCVSPLRGRGVELGPVRACSRRSSPARSSAA